jgi:predicted AlkP superfamily phosphohydrolase/phosphomutase/Flp pilus assembly protein TadD
MRPQDPKVIVIGWHGASWRNLHPLVDAGLLPNLQSLIDRGVIGNVKAAGFSLPAISWTTLATGKLADQHGILGAFEYDPLSGHGRLSGSASRRTKALWNIAMQNGLAAHVAGWAATFPAEPLNGSCITNEFVLPTGTTPKQWRIMPRSIHPPGFEAEAASLRLHPTEMSSADLAPFIDAVSEIDHIKDIRPMQAADILAREISMHAIVSSILEKQDWNLLMIGWHAFDRACHRFMRYAPPRMEGVSDYEERHYAGLTSAVLRFQDMCLGRLIELAGPETTFVLVSHGGFRTGEERPASDQLQQVRGAWYVSRGMVCIAGPGVAEDELVHGVTLLDIAPTVLALLGVPAAEDMPGKLIDGVARGRELPNAIASWESVAGDCGLHPGENDREREEAESALAELFASGYEDRRAGSQVALWIERHHQRNLALLQMSLNRFDEARAILEKLLEPDATLASAPEDAAIPMYLAHCQMFLGDRAGCRRTLERIPLDSRQGKLRSMMEPHLALADGDREAAAAGLEASGIYGIPMLDFGMAMLALRLGRVEDCEKRLRQIVRIDPAFALARGTLSWLLSIRGENEQAAAAALENIESDYASPFGHFLLGLAMVGEGDGDRALAAFEQAAALNPAWSGARAWAAAVRERKADQTGAAEA